MHQHRRPPGAPASWTSASTSKHGQAGLRDTESEANNGHTSYFSCVSFAMAACPDGCWSIYIDNYKYITFYSKKVTTAVQE